MKAVSAAKAAAGKALVTGYRSATRRFQLHGAVRRCSDLDRKKSLCFGKEVSKVSSKYQITLPRSVARAHGIHPGENLVFEDAGTAIYLRREGSQGIGRYSTAEALECFDSAVERQKTRNFEWPTGESSRQDRGWSRADLYEG